MAALSMPLDCDKSKFSSGLASKTIWGGRTSGTPPTSVDTTKSPQHAASKMAMQKDSVNEVFKKMCPLHKTFLTSECLSAPSSSTLECKLYFSTSIFICTILSPSPPMMKLTCGYKLTIFGINPISRSTPLRYCNLEMKTMLMTPFGSLLRISKFGLNLIESTAFGIIKAAFGLNLTRKQKFSLQVYDTQMAASKSLKDHFDNLFKLIPAASLYPNRECSVLMVFTP